jgi:glycosyltransferase involved in cell wall biosynthesis
MKIALLGPVCWRTPPVHYGPWEQVVSNIAEGMVSRGVDVTLFASGDSQTAGTLDWICPGSLYEHPELDGKVYEYLHIAHCYERAREFDLIHNNYDFMGLVWARLVPTPVLTTIHGFSSPRIHPAYHEYNGYVKYVSISDADRLTGLDYLATVYNGIDPARFTFSNRPGDYLLFLGRISAEKGAHLAIEVARHSGMKLIIAGIIQDQEYFDTLVQPFVDGRQIDYIGPVGPAARNELLSNAYALLHLITFREPFGLTMIEAGACGLPVIATPLGSVPEIIKDDLNGLIVPDADTAAQRLPDILKLDRAACRRHVEQHFSLDAMVDGYLKVYEQILVERG